MTNLFINMPYEDIRPLNFLCKNIAEVRLLYVTAGPEMVHRFGHALLHFVLKDQEDFVISYRGHVIDFKMSSLKGVTGGYTMRPFCFTLETAKFEYISNRQREMYSYKLNVTPHEKKLIYEKVIDDYWNFHKKYNFLTRNCTSGVAQVIETVCPHARLSPIAKRLPNNLVKELKKRNIIVKDPLYYPNLERARPKKMAKLYKAKKALEEKLLHHCLSEKGFSKENIKPIDLVEVIRDQFELRREKDSRHSPIDLKRHQRAKRWLLQIIEENCEFKSLHLELRSLL